MPHEYCFVQKFIPKDWISLRHAQIGISHLVDLVQNDFPLRLTELPAQYGDALTVGPGTPVTHKYLADLVSRKRAGIVGFVHDDGDLVVGRRRCSRSVGGRKCVERRTPDTEKQKVFTHGASLLEGERYQRGNVVVRTQAAMVVAVVLQL